MVEAPRPLAEDPFGCCHVLLVRPRVRRRCGRSRRVGAGGVAGLLRHVGRAGLSGVVPLDVRGGGPPVLGRLVRRCGCEVWPGDVTGQVVHAETAEPIAGAVLRLGSQTVRTDADGS